MCPENANFEIVPQIVPTGRESVITIRSPYGYRKFSDGERYQVKMIPAEGYSGQTARVNVPGVTTKPVDGRLSVPYTFETEQEYVLVLEEFVDGEAKDLAEFRLYALADDLFSCRPWKGDTHMHTFHSDGKQSPAFLAGACRGIGLDFMAVTDHHKYAPSLEAIEAFRDVETDLAIYPGEEIHPPENAVHMVNFGGSFSVNEFFSNDAYMCEVKAIEAGLGLPEGVDGYTYASCLWCFNKIREAGGLGIFCHPYWFAWHSYVIPAGIIDLLLERQPYDALELIGGYFLREAESNILQVARYHEERAQGKQIPIVGASDSHGCVQADLFGWYYTIVFSPTPGLADIIDGVKGFKSVAVEALPNGPARAFGPFRLVRYAQFLLREVFPAHDALCAEEGRLMQAHVAGDPSAREAINACRGRVADLYKRIWGA